MQTGKLKIKQRQIAFQMYIGPIFQWSNIQAWCKTWLTKFKGLMELPPQEQKEL